jgi:hypothetical protein
MRATSYLARKRWSARFLISSCNPPARYFEAYKGEHGHWQISPKRRPLTPLMSDDDLNMERQKGANWLASASPLPNKEIIRRLDAFTIGHTRPDLD